MLWTCGRSPKKKGWGFIFVDAYLKIYMGMRAREVAE